ncbi:long-chain-fatty-acid--CoA ligase [Sphingopyxis sp.]|uniref:long-chain-fatty-acid--CoA ligase n=1 Tax=Sphingopyxis sp. TaxID=1908224 RepID=UPI002636229E|nr:long-chain-fatty-acid--CoA ligase [Sphingopyxis sp.]MCW0200056.1 long-chain-fatty-acid--CoA ligase [Sphingopyxis sp.]
MGQPTTLPALAAHFAVTTSDNPAFVFAGRTTSFGAFEARCRRVAGALADAGVGLDSRVAWLSKNHVAGFELWVAANMLGATFVPLNWRLAPDELAFIIADAEALILFASAEYAAAARQAAAGVDIRIVVLDEGADWAHDATPLAEPVADDAEAISLQLYTSGTTGKPKGAMLSHRALLGARPLWRDIDWYRWDDGDAGLLAMPMFHIGGMGWALMAFDSGRPNIILPEFDVETILSLIDTRAFSKTFLVPAALQLLLDHPRADAIDFGGLKTVLYGASPMPMAVLDYAMRRLSCDFAQQYGMTETSGTVVALAPKDHVPGNPRLASAGQALPGVELEIRDAAGAPLPAGETGQIAIRAPLNLSGYWRRPDASAAATDADGWLLTGDAGYLDADGYLFVRDRLNDMIISGGENVYPAEVESVLSSHPAVIEVAVIGLPDARWGEAVTAAVVLRDGEIADAEIIAWMRGRIAGYKIPKRIERIPFLPRNGAGKILRRAIREDLAAQG